jgi:putative heme-binding domain-containing protein
LKGAALFRQHCATCHRFRSEGNPVGPDLQTVSDRSPEALLMAILEPNRAVEAKFLGYMAQLRDGRELSGVIVSETANAITMRAADGAEHVLRRADLQGLRGSGLSLMPEGFDQILNPKDMADLVAYLTGSAVSSTR